MKRKIGLTIIALGITALSAILSSCGYHMRGADRPFFKLHEINTLYVYPVQNNSYKAGVEITVYNALRKRFAQGGYVRLVDKPDQADAIMRASIKEALYSPAAKTTVDQLANSGANPGPNTVLIAASYSVSLVVGFSLVDRRHDKALWSDSLGKSKTFAASTYMGALGSTSALINEGEFERTLNDLAIGIAADAEESINTIF